MPARPSLSISIRTNRSSACYQENYSLSLTGMTHTLTPGVVFVIPPNVQHSGGSETGCRVLDAFAPVRDDYR